MSRGSPHGRQLEVKTPELPAPQVEVHHHHLYQPPPPPPPQDANVVNQQPIIELAYLLYDTTCKFGKETLSNLQEYKRNFSLSAFIEKHEAILILIIVGICALLFIGIVFYLRKIFKRYREQQLLLRAQVNVSDSR